MPFVLTAVTLAPPSSEVDSTGLRSKGLQEGANEGGRNNRPSAESTAGKHSSRNIIFTVEETRCYRSVLAALTENADVTTETPRVRVTVALHKCLQARRQRNCFGTSERENGEYT